MAVSDRTLKIPCALMRGGTSRGLVFERRHLPADRGEWDAIFLAAIGSPDPRQLDGVGAGDSHTSKVAVVSPSDADGSDVDYYFGEVSIDEARVDYAGNSGNIIGALGLYAVEEGWVAAEAPITTVCVRNVNTGKPTLVRVPVRDGAPCVDGDFSIDGVPGRGPRIDMLFPRPEGALTGRLLPAGEAVTALRAGDESVEATLVDAANPAVLLDGAALGVSPLTPLADLNTDGALIEKLLRIRAAASVRMGLVEREADAWAFSNMVPFPVLLFAPCDYPLFPDGARAIAASEMDVAVRVISLGRFHKSINVTMSVAVTAAALVPGSLAHRLSAGRALGGGLRIGHPSGKVETVGECAGEGEGFTVESVGIGRTARRIMQGEVLVPPYKLDYLRSLMSPTAARETAVPSPETVRELSTWSPAPSRGGDRGGG